MKLSEFDYTLPKELIAQEGLSKRDEARLMILHQDGSREDSFVKRLPELLHPGDLLILNDTKVLPAKLLGRKETGGKVDCLLLPQSSSAQSLSNIHNRFREVLLRGSRIKPGLRINFYSHEDPADKKRLQAKVIEKMNGALFRVEFSDAEMVEAFAQIPLPPYIKRPLSKPDRYQTIYSKKEGSLAAPTAGLHFTPDLMEKLRTQGIEFAFLTLHIDLGTFAPIRTENLEDWKMHSEHYRLSQETADKINAAIESKRRIFPVGTTTVRALESAAREGRVREGTGETNIFIYPPYQFKLPYSGLLTNFHLPKSTLLLLVSAFAESRQPNALSGREQILSAYQEAIEKKYRFYSFGDAMLLYKSDL